MISTLKVIQVRKDDSISYEFLMIKILANAKILLLSYTQNYITFLNFTFL